MICNMQKIEKSQIENYVGKPVYAKGICWNRSFDGWTVIYRRESGDLWFDYRGGNYSVDGFLPNEFTIGSSSNNCFSEFPLIFCKDCKYWQDNNGGYPHEECRWGNEETPDEDDFCSYGERKDS